MHILFATIDFIDNNGPTSGLPKYLFRTAKALIRMGHEVTIVTCSNRTVQYEFEKINVFRVRCPEIVKYGLQSKDEMAHNIMSGQCIHQKIEKICKATKIDIIQYTSLNGLAYFHDFPIPAVMRLSSYARMWPISGYEEGMEARAELEREAALKCDAIFGPSDVVAKRFWEDTGKRVDVIETPFVLEVEQEDRTLYENLFRGKKYVLFYGTLIEYKGLGTIADGIYRLLQGNEELYFGVIGNGEMKWLSDIVKNAGEYAERIIYHRGVGFSQLIPLIKNAELVVLPSLMENFSNACVESMALGQIVLGTQGASFEQLIEDGENGVLCQIGNVESFVDKIDEVLSYPKHKKEEMRQKARDSVERLKPERVTQQLVEYYAEVIKQQRMRLGN